MMHRIRIHGTKAIKTTSKARKTPKCFKHDWFLGPEFRIFQNFFNSNNLKDCLRNILKLEKLSQYRVFVVKIVHKVRICGSEIKRKCQNSYELQI